MYSILTEIVVTEIIPLVVLTLLHMYMYIYVSHANCEFCLQLNKQLPNCAVQFCCPLHPQELYKMLPLPSVELGSSNKTFQPLLGPIWAH